MNKLRLALSALFVTAIFAASSCKKTVDTSATAQYIGVWNGTNSCGEGLGGWTQRASFLGTGRKGATNFSINNTDIGNVYVVGGTRFKDCWSYSPKTNLWTHLADFPGATNFRAYASGFSIDDRGYLACGSDSGFYKNDLWMYDLYSDTWTQKASFPGKPRIKAFSFVCSGVAYVGGGIDTGGVALKDVWAYYPGSDTWVARPDLPQPVSGGSGFSCLVNQTVIGFVTCGLQNGIEDTATFAFDSVANAWTRVAGFPGHSRQGASAFTLNNVGYCALGNTMNSFSFSDVYAYNASLNKWNKVGDFPGSYNAMPVAGTAFGKGYMGMGGDVGTNTYSYWYEFTPPSNSASFTITAGSNNFSVNMNYTVGKDTCAHEVSLTGTVSTSTAGKEAFSIGTHNVVDKCGVNYSITGSGSLSGDLITITIISASPHGESACTFTGKR